MNVFNGTWASFTQRFQLKNIFMAAINSSFENACLFFYPSFCYICQNAQAEIKVSFSSSRTSKGSNFERIIILQQFSIWPEENCDENSLCVSFFKQLSKRNQNGKKFNFSFFSPLTFLLSGFANNSNDTFHPRIMWGTTKEKDVSRNFHNPLLYVICQFVCRSVCCLLILQKRKKGHHD